MQSLNNSYKAISLTRPASLSSTNTGTGVDVGLEYLDDAMAILNVGTVTGTSPTLDVTIQGSTDDSTYTTITTFSQVTASTKLGAGAVKMTTSGTNYRYVRALCTIAGTSPVFPVSVVILVRKEAGSSTTNSTTPA